MKIRLTVIGLLFVFAFSFAQEEGATGIQFFKGTFEDAKAQAQAEGKLIFVDAYAVWCGPCKRMSSTVFPNEEVGKVYNQFYISLKIDMEKPMGQAFGKNYPVQAYPTLFYMDAEGNILEKVVGGRSVEDFIALGQKFSSKATPGGINYSKKYDEGDRSAETVYHYIAQMNRSGKNILPVVNEFLRKQTSWESEWELRFLYEASVESDSKVFETFLARKKALEKYYTAAEIEERIEQACLRTVVKAAEYDYPELLNQTKAIVKENVPRRHKSVLLQADLLYAAETQDSKAFVKYMGDVEKTFEDEPAILIALAEKAEKNFSSHPQVSEKVLSWMEKALKKNETSAGYFKLAQLYYKKGNVPAAREKALKALQIAETKKENTFPIESFIQRLEKS